MNINYQVLKQNDCTKDLLFGYERYTKTTKMFYVKGGTLATTNVDFIDDWSSKDLESIATYLCHCITLGGKVVVAKQDNLVIGFASLEEKRYPHGYGNMAYCHVSKPFRGQGIGQKLFNQIASLAKEANFQKLYISAHPSIETQAFYHRVGCTLATHIIPELYDKEPADIQMEYPL